MADSGPEEVPPPHRNPARPWVFTWNNPPADAYDRLQAQRSLFSACFVGREVGASGTPHLQGVLISKKPCRLASLVRLFPGVHFEVMRGPEKAAVEYTRKEGNPDRCDWDDRQQGSRTDLAAVASVVKANPRVGVRAVATEMPVAFLKFHAGVTALSRALLPTPPRVRDVQVFWLHGPTGTGKSHTADLEAHAAAGGDATDVYRWTIQSLKWAGNYAGQRNVIFEELRPTWADFTFARLLVLLDKYACDVELKGTQVPWCATRIWITSALAPEQFLSPEEHRVNPYGTEQLFRRITSTRHLTVPYGPRHPAYVCADSADEAAVPAASSTSQPCDSPVPVAVVGTPPLPRRVLPPTQADSDTDAAELLQRRGAMCLRGLVSCREYHSDSDCVVTGL